MGAGVATSPHCLGSIPCAPRGASCPPAERFERAVGARLRRLPGSPHEARRPRRFAAGRASKDPSRAPSGQPAALPPERAPEGTSLCRGGNIEARASPVPPAAGSVEPPFLLRASAPGGSRRRRIGCGWRNSPASPPLLPPAGLLPRLPRSRHPGLTWLPHLAAASSAALALHGPPRKARRSGRGDRGFVRFLPAPLGHGPKLSPFPIREKGESPVENEDNGDGTS